MKRITASQFQTSERYYKLPKLLFESERYKDMKLEVKVAYAVLKDRLELSLSRGWIDEEGAIYLVYSNSKLMALLGCSKSKLLTIKKTLREKEEIMYFMDLFAGIGGFRMGMEAAGHTCLAYCEIDKFARQSYQAMYNLKGEMEYHDIKQITDQEFRQFRGKVDVICGGFPCQAFSLAGRRLGFEDTRGTLFFEIARAAKQIKPRFLFLENVKGLLSHDKGRTFRAILATLDELGYDVEWQVLNT